MRLVNRLREDAHPIWEKMIEHPFVVALCEGELPLDKFKFYILQDYHYLVTAMRNFSIIASKAPSVESLREIIDILSLEAKSEFDGYVEFLKRLGVTIEDAAAIEPIPVSVSYGGFLLSTSSLRSYAEAIASVLPCFWSYAEIADHHRERLNSNKIELYRDWGSAYVSDSYLRLVEKLKKLVDEAGEGAPYESLRAVFFASSRYEYMFWEAVYHQQEWPV
jgi:thiaminase/transcriptional activator TenA